MILIEVVKVSSIGLTSLLSEKPLAFWNLIRRGCLKGIEKTPIEKNFERNNIILVEICSSNQVHWIMFEMFISILFYWNQIEVIQT